NTRLFYVFTAKIIETHQTNHALLAAFMPLVMATGGTVGIQAGTLVIRALTIGGLQPREIPIVLWKEIRISLGLAVVLSAIIFVEAFMIGGAEEGAMLLSLCAAMSLAMIVTVAATSLFGSAIPLIAQRLGRDPAMVSGPAITALADLSGATVYLSIVAAVL
ncbi:MAG: magnesium transporter, partial [Planctomycetes bacterium]|nr:magnesium transporter [Planctomycetota bacterium]